MNEQRNKQFRFRELVAADLSAEFKNLVTQILEPNYKSRITLNGLNSDPYLKMAIKSPRPIQPSTPTPTV